MTATPVRVELLAFESVKFEFEMSNPPKEALLALLPLSVPCDKFEFATLEFWMFV